MAIKSSVSVLGAGSWGLALAKVLWENGHSVKIWEFDAGIAEKIDRERSVEDKLPGVKLPTERFDVFSDMQKCIEKTNYIVIAVPSVYYRATVKTLGKFYIGTQNLISVTKGMENETFKVMSQIIEEEIPNVYGKICVVSGPSHAEGVAERKPTTVVAASKNSELSQYVQELFSNEYFRVYKHYDEIGVQIAGAVKNIIAIAAGIVDGMNLGDNAKAALITRGMVEIVRLGRVMGAQHESMLGLAGVGDLIVTCTSTHSRNRYVGNELGKGRKLDEILSGMTMVAEGIPTCKSVYNLSKKLNIDMPIVEQCYGVLFMGVDIKTAITNLMTRELRQEGFY